MKQNAKAWLTVLSVHSVAGWIASPPLSNSILKRPIQRRNSVEAVSRRALMHSCSLSRMRKNLPSSPANAAHVSFTSLADSVGDDSQAATEENEKDVEENEKGIESQFDLSRKFDDARAAKQKNDLTSKELLELLRMIDQDVDLELELLLERKRQRELEGEPEVIDTSNMGLNEIQTIFRNAVKTQDFREAERLSNVIAGLLSDTEEEKARRRERLSWRQLGVASWLEARLDAMDFLFPSTIQVNALEAVHSILGSQNNEVQNEEGLSLGDRLLSSGNMGVVISGNTGSGKTLAYMVPMLSTLSESLFYRQRLRFKAEEDVGTKTEEFLARISIAAEPQVRGARRVGGEQGASLAALGTLGRSGRDVMSPLALIVVPTRELGVQTAQLLYEMVGGKLKEKPTQRWYPGRSVEYEGPKGVKIACVLDDEEAIFGMKMQTDVAITSPKYLGRLIRDRDIKPELLRVVVFDEADLALEQTSNVVLDELFHQNEVDRNHSRLTYLVGASVTEALGNFAVKSSVLPEGSSYIATATRFTPLTEHAEQGILEESHLDEKSRKASLKDLGICLDPGLRHQRVIATNGRGILSLTRMLRKALNDYETDFMDQFKSPEGGGSGKITTIKSKERPRVVIFFSTEEQARNAIVPLRDALWGEHQLCVLLPNTGMRPLQIMEQFKKYDTSVMLATPNSVRGLDFPQVTHVYTLHLPADDPREYVHLAGRVGRIGQVGSVLGEGGRVVSILRPGDAEKFEVMAEELGFEFEDIEPPGEEMDRTEESEELKKYLEESMRLLRLADDPDVDLGAVVAEGSKMEDTSDLSVEPDDDEDEVVDESEVDAFA